MSQPTVDSLIATLEERARTGQLGGIEIEYWVGGGLPPPYYRSEQLRLLTVDGQDTLELAILRFDERYDPPSLVEKWQLPARPADVREVVRLLLATQVFRARYPEEDDLGVADILSTEIIVTVPPGEHKRRYFRRVPPALEPLRAAVEAFQERLQREGKRGLSHQGRPVPGSM